MDNIELEFATRVGCAILAGAIVGMERLLSHKIAGMRTYAMVSAGAASFAFLATTAFPGVNANPYVIIGQIVVGIGFLGAGSLINDHGKINGLTTASGLWVTAAAGVAFGLGLYKIGFLISAFSFLVLAVLIKVELFFVNKYLPEDDIKHFHMETRTRKITGEKVEDKNIQIKKVVRKKTDNQKLETKID